LIDRHALPLFNVQQMKRSFIIGILVSGSFAYLALRGINVSEIKAGLKQADYSYLVPIFLLSIFVVYLRSYRWGIMLDPLERISQKVLFPITAVGLMAVVLLPVRMGELARPILVSKRSEVRISSALGTIVVERVFDGLTLMLFLLFTTHFVDLPGWVYQAGLSVMMIFVLILFFLVLLIYKRDFSLTWVGFLFKRFPDRIGRYVMRVLTSFADGLKILPDAKGMICLALLSVLVWLSIGLCIYLFFHSFHFNLPFIAACVVLVLTALGIMAPTAPGFVGNFHLFCIIGLSLFGIPKTEALSFAILLHFIQVGLVGIMGIAFIPLVKIPFFELFAVKKQIQR